MRETKNVPQHIQDIVAKLCSDQSLTKEEMLTLNADVIDNPMIDPVVWGNYLCSLTLMREFSSVFGFLIKFFSRQPSVVAHLEKQSTHSAMAQFYLGFMQCGESIENNSALKYLRSAADSNLVVAQAVLMIYLNQNFDELKAHIPNLGSEIAALYEKAEENNYLFLPESYLKFILACGYVKPTLGLEERLQAFIGIIEKKFPEKNTGDAFYQFAKGLNKINFNAGPNLKAGDKEKTVFRLMLLAAEKGYFNAMIQVSRMYRNNGQGINVASEAERNLQAFRWAQTAALTGNDNGINELAFLYLNYTGLSEALTEAERYQKAFELYQKIENSVSGVPSHQLGYMYSRIPSFKPELTVAERWRKAHDYYLAALSKFQSKNDRAKTNDALACLYLESAPEVCGLTEIQKNAKAESYFKIAAENGDRDAMFALAKMLIANQAGLALPALERLEKALALCNGALKPHVDNLKPVKVSTIEALKKNIQTIMNRLQAGTTAVDKQPRVTDEQQHVTDEQAAPRRASPPAKAEAQASRKRAVTLESLKEELDAAKEELASEKSKRQTLENRVERLEEQLQQLLGSQPDIEFVGARYGEELTLAPLLALSAVKPEPVDELDEPSGKSAKRGRSPAIFSDTQKRGKPGDDDTHNFGLGQKNLLENGF